jgi:hypothetical protein
MSVINGALSQFRAGRNGFFGDDFLPAPPSGVVAGTYGDGTHVGQFTVNTAGDITAAANVTITGAAPTGPAGGALTGTYPNPQFAVQTQLLDMGSHKVVNVTDGTANNDAVNVEQLYAPKGLVFFTVSSATLTDTSIVQYSNSGGSNITQAAGVITMTNPTNFTQGYVLVFSIYGYNSGQTSTFYMQDGGGGIYGAADTGVTSANNVYRIVAYTLISANTSATAKILYRQSGGTYNVVVHGQGAVGMRNAFQVMQVY